MRTIILSLYLALIPSLLFSSDNYGSDGKYELVFVTKKGVKTIIPKGKNLGGTFLHKKVVENDENAIKSVTYDILRSKDKTFSSLLDPIKIKTKTKEQFVTWDGASALHLAAYLGHTEIVKLLLDSGIKELRAPTIEGKTALMYAACEGHKEIVHILVNSNYEEFRMITNTAPTVLNFCIKGDQLELFLFFYGKKDFSLQYLNFGHLLIDVTLHILDVNIKLEIPEKILRYIFLSTDPKILSCKKAIKLARMGQNFKLATLLEKWSSEGEIEFETKKLELEQLSEIVLLEKEQAEELEKIQDKLNTLSDDFFLLNKTIGQLLDQVSPNPKMIPEEDSL